MAASNCGASGLFRLSWLVLIGVLLLIVPHPLPAADLELKDWKRLNYEAVSEDPVEILRMIAEKSEANYEKIKTWSAAFRFEDKTSRRKIEGELSKALSKAAKRDLEGATVSISIRGMIEFEIDIAKESFYSRKVDERCVITDSQTGQVLADLNQEQDSLPVDEESKIDMLNTWNAIVTPEQSIHMQPDTSYQNGRTAFREPRENGLRWGTLVDPRQLFGEGIAHWEMARSVGKILEVLASEDPPKEKGLQELLKAKPKVTVKQAKTDDGPIYWVRFEARTLKTGVMRTDYRFDGRVGFNLVQSRTTTNGQVVSDMEWSYIKSDDVFVPRSLVKMMTDRETGKLSYQRNLDFTRCKVNGPLHPDGFGYKRLGLKDGDRVVDRLQKTVYVLDGKELKPVDDSK